MRNVGATRLTGPATMTESAKRTGLLNGITVSATESMSESGIGLPKTASVTDIHTANETAIASVIATGLATTGRRSVMARMQAVGPLAVAAVREEGVGDDRDEAAMQTHIHWVGIGR